VFLLLLLLLLRLLQTKGGSAAAESSAANPFPPPQDDEEAWAAVSPGAGRSSTGAGAGAGAKHAASAGGGGDQAGYQAGPSAARTSTSNWLAERDAYFMGPCPHDWLFQQVAAVVHHGGAGTDLACTAQ
jgi:hypothetical protein